MSRGACLPWGSREWPWRWGHSFHEALGVHFAVSAAARGHQVTYTYAGRIPFLLLDGLFSPLRTSIVAVGCVCV